MRATIATNENGQYISVIADELCEDDGYIKAYSAKCGLVAVIDMQFVKWAYMTEEKGR